MVIPKRLTKATPLSGKGGVDENYFGGRRKGKRGRGVANAGTGPFCKNPNGLMGREKTIKKSLHIFHNQLP